MLKEEFADFIPRTKARVLVDQRLHECIDDEPAGEDDNESDGDIHEYLFCTRYLTGIGDVGEVLEARQGKEYR